MRRFLLRAIPICCTALIGAGTLYSAISGAQQERRYRIESRSDRVATLHERFSESQMALLEKLNRADTGHLEQLPELLVPESWDDELSFSRLPLRYP
jgi:hypothetical protein